MSLRYAILSLLTRQPMTGYDLTKMFDSSVGFFWSAKHSQIYPELAGLTKDGFVTFEVVTQTSKPNKKVYTITEEGRADLATWVAEPSEKRTLKDPLLLRTWAIGCVDAALVLPHLRSTLAELERREEGFKQAEQEMQEDGVWGGDSEWLGATMSLKLGMMQSQTYQEWLRWAIAQLEQSAAKAAAAGA